MLLKMRISKNKMKKSIEIKRALKENRPCAIVVKKGTFNVYGSTSQTFDEELMTREESLEIILERLPKNSIIVSTTGKTSREIFEIREKNNRVMSFEEKPQSSIGLINGGFMIFNSNMLDYLSEDEDWSYFSQKSIHA